MSSRRRSKKKASSDENEDEDDTSDDEEQTLPRVVERPSRFSWKMPSLVGVAIALGLLVAYLGLAFYNSKEVFVPRGMTRNMPTVQCRPVTKEDILLLQADVHWRHTVKSMYWHMEEGELEGISAFHMGDPTCFILIRTAGGILPMFNTAFRGYSANSIVSRDEESLACPGVIRNMLRAMHVRVSYIDAATREDMIERFSGVESFAVQHVNFYSQGKTICDLHASNADQGVQTLKKLIASDTSS
jgi:peptide deformylase